MAKRVKPPAREHKVNGERPLYTYCITVAVDDEKRLQRATESVAYTQGYDLDQWRSDRRGPGTDLALALDPITPPPGCRFVESSVEEI